MNEQLRYAVIIDALQGLIDQMKLEAAGWTDATPAVAKKPSKAITDAMAAEEEHGKGASTKRYWATMTPEERSEEMRRRAEVTRKKQGKRPPIEARVNGEITKHQLFTELGIGNSTLERRLTELGFKAHIVPRPGNRGRVGVFTQEQETIIRESFAAKPAAFRGSHEPEETAA